MNQLLTTRRLLIGVIVLAVAGAAAFGTYTAVHTQQQNAASVNGINLAQGNVDGLATVAARVRSHYSNYNPTLADIARREIDYQEALKLGDACSIADAQKQIADTISQAQATNTVDALLIAVEDSGLAPSGYHLTPVGQRTPDTNTVISSYAADPNVQQLVQHLCAIGRMVATVQAGARTPAVAQSGSHSNDAVATFRAGLYAHSTVIAASGSPIDVRVPAATPTP
jgi:predicted TIM-barrel enzyme